ncbi:hypothetical protein LCGC14_0951210 [marine sediment metagenome]|uniref:C-methyltransferase domain-containing protein n=1 Tax=marine sediment metagenome TaxID=412755 RepID=A0A0F9R0R3_9ZZZZ
MLEIQKEYLCRVCKGELVDRVNFGEIYPSAFVENHDGLTKAPLILASCVECNLVQLRHTVSLDSMYRQYWYRSGLNPSMRNDLKDIANSIIEKVTILPGDIIVDIGCNDGTLFNFFPDYSFKIGFDPAKNLERLVGKNCDRFFNEYFPHKKFMIKAKVITSIAMFYDLPDPMSFISAIKDMLTNDGIWVIQLTDLFSMLRINAFDNICFEHLEYYTLSNLISMLSEFDLEIFDLEYNKVNGGSLRVYVSHPSAYPYNREIVKYLITEANYLNSDDDFLSSFINRIFEIGKSLVTELQSQHEVSSIFVLGASTKGNTLLQLFSIDNTIIDYAAEINEEKFGLRTVGSNIEIISEEKALEMNPDFLLCLPWAFKETFLNKKHIREYMQNGGSLIFPLPYLHICTMQNDEIIEERL